MRRGDLRGCRRTDHGRVAGLETYLNHNGDRMPQAVHASRRQAASQAKAQAAAI